MVTQKISTYFSSLFTNDFFLSNSIGEDLSLCDNGNILFNWSDYHETCTLVKNRLQTDSLLASEYKKFKQAIMQLNLIPIWIKTDKSVQEFTLFNLYQNFILHRSAFASDLDPFVPIQISFISGSGPYKYMSLTECFNEKTYKDFVIFYIIEEKIPNRDFRIRLRSKVLLSFGLDFTQAELVSIEQLTSKGILVSMDSDIYFNKISHSRDIRLLINYHTLAQALDKDLMDLKSYLSQYIFNFLYSSQKEDFISCSSKDFTVQSSFDFLKSRKIFLFLSYDKLSSPSSDAVVAIRNFVEHARSLVSKHYQVEISVPKTA